MKFIRRKGIKNILSLDLVFRGIAFRVLIRKMLIDSSILPKLKRCMYVHDVYNRYFNILF